MSRKCTREQMREIDRRAIEEYGIPGVVLMENAGRGAAQVGVDMIETPARSTVLIFCGKGNNGGDGFVVARHLHNAGVTVRMVLAYDPDKNETTPDAAVNFAITRKMGIPAVLAETDAGRLDATALAAKADLIVDALLGTGLSGEVRDPYLSLIRIINAADRPVLAIDIPSGLDANTGAVLRCAVRATHTVTFALAKVGFDLNGGPAHTGPVTVVDIGVPRELLEVP